MIQDTKIHKQVREHAIVIPGYLAQSLTCLTADMCLTADPGVASLIQARSHTSWRLIDHEIISKAISFLSADSRRSVSYKRKYIHQVLVNCLVKPAQEKVWLCELTLLS